MIATTTAPARQPITKLQERLYRYIRRYYRVHKAGPEFADIGRAFGMKPPYEVANHVRTLETRGFVEWERFRSRTIRPLMGFLEEKMIDLPLDETEVLSAIAEVCLSNGEMPTLLELADHVKSPTSEVISVIRRLERRGLVQHTPGVPRSITINTDRAFTSY